MNQALLNEFKSNPVKLVSVTKTRDVDEIAQLYELGFKDFGENRVQELLTKVDKLPEDISWHIIGHLQKNKVKYIGHIVDWIHSVDSFALLKKIDHQAKKHNRQIKILFQFKIAQEDTKYGFDLESFESEIKDLDLNELSNVKFCGVMGMASFVSDETQVENEFKSLKSIYNTLKTKHFSDFPEFKEISMGMSGDYKIAIQQGSTMVRIGSLIFKN